MYVNGQLHAHREGLTLHTLLSELSVDRRAVVVMHGDDIYRTDAIPDIPVGEPDVIEIVTMMQGG